MKKTGLVILMLGLCASSFAMAKHKKKQSRQGGEITSVMTYHSVCYGRCPEYRVEINANGLATYTAMRFTADTGIFQKNIGKAVAKEIIDMCTANRIDTCRNVYENRIVDIPSITFTVNYGAQKKEIRNAGFGPAFLKEISAKMDEVGVKPPENNGWKKIGMPNLR